MTTIKPRLRIPNTDGTPSNEWTYFPFRYDSGSWKLWNGSNLLNIGTANNPVYLNNGQVTPVSSINKNLVPSDIKVDTAQSLASKNIGNTHVPTYFNSDGKPAVITGISVPLVDSNGNTRTIGTINRPVYYNAGVPTVITSLSTLYGGTGQAVNAWSDIKVGYSNEIAMSGSATGDIPLVLTATANDSNGYRQLQTDTDLKWRTTENRLIAPAATITSLSSTSIASQSGTINSLIVSKIQRQLSDGSLVEFGNRYSLSKSGDTITLTATDGSTSSVTDNHTDTTKLPLAGGTMTGNITFSAMSTVGSSSKGLVWSGGTDGASIYYSLPSSDEGHLVFNMTDDSNTRIDFNNSGSTKSYITMSDGKYHGTSTTSDLATALKDAGNGNSITAQYSGNGVAAADWYTAWNGYKLVAISKDTVKAAMKPTLTTSTASAITGVGANETATVLTGVKATGNVTIPSSISVGNAGSAITGVSTSTISKNAYNCYISGSTLYISTTDQSIATGSKGTINVPSITLGSNVTAITGVAANGTVTVLKSIKATSTKTFLTGATLS